MLIERSATMVVKNKKEVNIPPQSMTLQRSLSFQGVPPEIKKTQSDFGGPSPSKDSSFLLKKMAEMQSDEDFRNIKVGGNLDRYGNPRRNVGGRPKDPRSGWSANLSRKQRLQAHGPKKAKILEIYGQVQKEMCEKLDELEKKYPT